MDNLTICAIVPAAGQSSRFGSQKMLYQHQGKSLLAHTLDALDPNKFKSITIVTGKHSDEIKAELNSTLLDFITVDQYDIGLGFSIATAMNDPKFTAEGIDAVLILLGDQIHVTKNDIEELLDAAKSNPTKIICARYNNIVGVPCFIPHHYFEQLKTLHDDEGAKKIIQKNRDNCIAIDLTNAGKDIDRKEDLSRFIT